MALPQSPPPRAELHTPLQTALQTPPQPPAREPAREPARDRPSPLRIVKRPPPPPQAHHRAPDAEPERPPCAAAAAEPLAGRLPLRIAKRRGRGKLPPPPPAGADEQPAAPAWERDAAPGPPGAGFWASSAELMSRPRGRIWEDTLMRCRGLLARSTPSLRDPPPPPPSRQAWPLGGRHGAHRGASSCRTASSGSGSSAGAYDGSILSCASRQSSGARRVSGRLVSPPPPGPRRLECGPPAPPSVLSPCISVTSDVDGDSRSIWAAVEVSGRLSRIPSSRSPSSQGAPSASPHRSSFIAHPLDRFFEYGCLYDLSVEILPTSESTIAQVIQEQAFPTTIYAGSSLLVVVHVEVDGQGAKGRGAGRHVRQKSDELMEDLELELGSSVAGFMQVRVSYSHSAFPEHRPAEAAEAAAGVFSLRSRMETTAGATLRRRKALSVWSPQSASLPSQVVPLVERHWGPDKALSIRRLIQRSAGGQGGSGQGGSGQDGEGDSPTLRTPSRSASRSASHQHEDDTPRAAPPGMALGKRPQRRLPPPSPPPSPLPSFSSPPPPGGSRGRRGPPTPAEERLDGVNPGNRTKDIDGGDGSLRRGPARLGVEARMDPTRNALCGPEGSRLAGRHQEGTTEVQPDKDMGLWSWGVWF